MLLSNIYREIHDLLGAENHHINESKTNAMPAFIPGEQHQADLIDGELLVVLDKIKFLGYMYIVNSQGTKGISNMINLAQSIFYRLQPCVRSLHEIPLRAKGSGAFGSVLRG